MLLKQTLLKINNIPAYIKLGLFSIGLFLLLLPLIRQIDFMQNDDWVYYKNVDLIRHFGLKLDPYMGPTFFVQGVLGSLYTRVFSSTSLPVLTLLMSVISFYLFTYILTRFLKLNVWLAILLGLLMYFTPINVYTSIGFMTEQYFMPLFLLCIVFFLHYEESHTNTYLYLLLTTIFLALNQRQVALMFPISFSIYYFLKGRFKVFFLFVLDLIIMFFYYTFVFPRTDAMLYKSFEVKNLFQYDYIFAVLYGTGIILVALLLPLFVSFIYTLNFPKFSKKYLFFFVILFLLVFKVLNGKYNPETVSWGEFPYFENTWERTGLYPRGVIGTKYQFRANYDLYRYWDIVSKIVLSTFLVTMLLKFRKYIDIYIIISLVYVGILCITNRFYDRYIVFLVPLLILFLANNIDFKSKFKSIHYLLLTGFISFMIFYSYQVAMDFIYVNNYIWNKSSELVKETKISPTMIHGTNAWKLNYLNLDRNYTYIFSYDSPEINDKYATEYETIEIKSIDYPLNLYISPKVYLYKLVGTP